MSSTRNLANIRDAVRFHADIVGSDFASDGQLDYEIDQSAKALQAMLTRADPDRFVGTSTISTTAGTKTYSLPSDFLVARVLWLVDGENRWRIDRYTLAEAYDYVWPYGTSLNLPYGHVRYRLMGGGMDGSTAEIWFEPDPGTNSFELVYAKAPELFTGDADTIDGIAGFEDWIVYDVAAKVLEKEDNLETAQIKTARKAEVEARISLLAPDRDMGQPDQVQDLRAYERNW